MVTYNLYFITDFIFRVQDACALLNSTLGMFSKANTDKPEKKNPKTTRPFHYSKYAHLGFSEGIY